MSAEIWADRGVGSLSNLTGRGQEKMKGAHECGFPSRWP